MEKQSSGAKVVDFFFFQVKDGHFGIHNNKDSFSGLRGAFNSRG